MKPKSENEDEDAKVSPCGTPLKKGDRPLPLQLVNPWIMLPSTPTTSVAEF